MKSLIALMMLTSFSAFASLQDTLIDARSNDDDIKKALYLDVLNGTFKCVGSWNNSFALISLLKRPSMLDSKFTLFESATNPSIIAEGGSDGKKMVFTFYISEDLMKVKSFRYQEWEISKEEVNVGTLMKPVFEILDTRRYEKMSNCTRQY